jgi:hypothetical protein
VLETGGDAGAGVGVSPGAPLALYTFSGHEYAEPEVVGIVFKVTETPQAITGSYYSSLFCSPSPRRGETHRGSGWVGSYARSGSTTALAIWYCHAPAASVIPCGRAPPRLEKEEGWREEEEEEEGTCVPYERSGGGGRGGRGLAQRGQSDEVAVCGERKRRGREFSLGARSERSAAVSELGSRTQVNWDDPIGSGQSCWERRCALDLYATVSPFPAPVRGKSTIWVQGGIWGSSGGAEDLILAAVCPVPQKLPSSAGHFLGSPHLVREAHGGEVESEQHDDHHVFSHYHG